MKYFISLFLLSISLLSCTQNPEAITVVSSFEKVSITNTDSTHIYVNDKDSQELYYLALKPKGSIQGTLVLFPPTWQTTESVIAHNVELIKMAKKKDILVIIPSINYNLYLDEISLAFLNTVFKNVSNKYQPPINKYVFGGFSLGGMNAIRYTEMAYENEAFTTIKPIAVYGVDPPLDLTRLYHSFENTIAKQFSEPAINEAQNYLQKMNDQFGGPPEEKPLAYIKNSMYSKREKKGGNAQFLVSLPVRIYCDPDIDWQLTNRRMDYYDMNAVDQTAMINQLMLLGNKKAEFINALGKGYRLDGRRHPHSWSLVDPQECIDWIMDCLQ